MITQQISGECHRSDAGFTLAEMLVVMTLISLSASIAFVSYQNNSESVKLERISKQIVQMLRTARIDAILKQRNQLVIFDLNSRKIYSNNKLSEIVIPQDILINITVADGQIALKNATFKNQVGVRFFTIGGSTGANVLVGRNETWNKISVDWLLGTVLFEGNVDGK